MAFCGRAVFIVLILGLSFVHSDTSFPETCDEWKRDPDRIEEVNFDGKFVLTSANCGEKVELDKFTGDVPTVTYPKAVRVYFHFTFNLIRSSKLM